MNKTSFISDFSFVENEAQAALGVNPSIKWAKFIFTDDMPNGNHQRIPLEEFENVVKTGVFMPIKMASGAIEEGHKYAEPLGTISHLKQSIIDGRNVVEGLAAFWMAEREDDINLLKAMTEDNNNPQLSWEVWYDDSDFTENVENLHGVVVRASTIVGKPAYKGRTPILAMSAITENEIIPGEKSKEDAMELEQKIAELEEELARCKEELDKAKAELEKRDENLETMNSSLVSEKESLMNELEAAKSELISLREFKASIEKMEAEASKLAEIKDKFVKAGLQKTDEYFVQNKDRFLAMSDETIEFMLQEMVASFKVSTASIIKENKIDVPNLPGEGTIDYTNVKEIARLLREKGSK